MSSKVFFVNLLYIFAQTAQELHWKSGQQKLSFQKNLFKMFFSLSAYLTNVYLWAFPPKPNEYKY